MAEVISKTSLFIGACGNHHRVDDFSVSPVGFGLKKSFSSLKVKNQKPLISEFHGKQIVFGDAQTESFKKSFRSSSITAQVKLIFFFVFFISRHARSNYRDLES